MLKATSNYVFQPDVFALRANTRLNTALDVMTRKALTNIAIAVAIYAVSLLLVLYVRLPSALEIIFGLLVGPTQFLFCSIDPRWSHFLIWVVIVAVIVAAGVLIRGAGLAASLLALLVWLGSGIYAAIFNGETC